MHDEVMGDKYTPAVGNDGNFLANVNDDDGAILDSLVSSEAEPPKPDELPIVRIDMRPVPDRAIPPRIIMRSRSMFLTKGVPYLLATANPWRLRALIGGNKTGFLMFGPSSTIAQMRSDNFRTSLNASVTLEMRTTEDIWVVADADDLYVSIMEEIKEETGR